MIKINMGDVKITLFPRTAGNSTRAEYNAKCRVYVWNLESNNEELKASEAGLPEPKLKGEDKENDKAYNAHNRLIAKLTKEAAIKYVTMLVEDGMIEFPYANLEDVKFKFSRTAGCSCPCSPGVTMDCMVREVEHLQKVDIHISF